MDEEKKELKEEAQVESGTFEIQDAETKSSADNL